MFLDRIGTNPALKTILLNSHTDGVPVYQVKTRSTFSSPDARCNIYAQGMQDMECMYIQDIRRLKGEGRKFTRTIHLMFVPDEEVGGLKGMETFVKLPEFQKFNIGFAHDEGELRKILFVSLLPSGIMVHCPGSPGHGSRFVENTAAEKLRNVINSFLDFREKEKVRLVRQCFTLGDITTINMTMVKVGVAYNVIPAEMDVSFDLRIPPTVNLQVCAWAGEGITYEFAQMGDPWWNTFSTTCLAMNMTLEKEIFSAATDSCFIRAIMFVLLLVGLPAIGFSPMNRTLILLHDHNEYLNEQVFLKGIQLYEKLVPALANVPALLCDA
uniref:N-acyl-aliphatic-L-amino acid amidohydrolase n=1 Tax=Hucho hucho TaxID=62062 RepID=A0A4W5MHW4_9TELE